MQLPLRRPFEAAVERAPQKRPVSWPHVHVVSFAAWATAIAIPTREPKERSCDLSIMRDEDLKPSKVCEFDDGFAELTYYETLTLLICPSSNVAGEWMARPPSKPVQN